MQTILFSEEKIGKLTLRNRLVVPPMCMWQAQDGKVNDFHLQHYAQLAGAGMAAVTIEATAVTPDGRISPWCLGIWDDDHAEGIAAMVKAMRKSDPEVKICCSWHMPGARPAAPLRQIARCRLLRAAGRP